MLRKSSRQLKAEVSMFSTRLYFYGWMDFTLKVFRKVLSIGFSASDNYSGCFPAH